MKLADVYLRDGRTVAYATAPGTRIQFVGGRAVVRDEGSLLWALRRADCVVVPDPRYASHVPRWLAACGEHAPARARIDLPPGAPAEAPDARVRRR